MQQTDLQRVKHIRDYCIQIQNAVSRFGDSLEAFLSDKDDQRSVSFCIFQIGELIGKISPEFRRATAGKVQWAPMKGMRNLVVHNYGEVDMEIIWETAAIDIPALRKFCEEQLSEQ